MLQICIWRSSCEAKLYQKYYYDNDLTQNTLKCDLQMFIWWFSKVSPPKCTLCFDTQFSMLPPHFKALLYFKTTQRNIKRTILMCLLKKYKKLLKIHKFWPKTVGYAGKKTVIYFKNSFSVFSDRIWTFHYSCFSTFLSTKTYWPCLILVIWETRCCWWLFSIDCIEL